MITIAKLLTGNDLGITGSHQAGILIPKTGGYLAVFPMLDSEMKNPRRTLAMADEEGRNWLFSFVYYNGKRFGGTRDEFRLTGMTRYFRERNAAIGDHLNISREGANQYRVWLAKSIEWQSHSHTVFDAGVADEKFANELRSKNEFINRNLVAEITPRRVWTITVRK